MQYRFPETGIKATDDLGRQFERIMRTANRGSIGTRYRYADAGTRFIKWVQPTFRMQKLANLSDKHLIAYAQQLKSQGKTDKYIKNELAALRYIHSITPNTRHELGNSDQVNLQAGLGSTPNNKAVLKNQTWQKDELDRFVTYAKTHGKPKLAIMAQIAYYSGTRLEEIATVRHHQFEDALRTGQLHLENTKGGKPRDIPITGILRILLQEALQGVARGDYVFIPIGTPVHRFKSQCQDYLYNHRKKFQDPTRVGDSGRTELHFHCLRHSFAQNTYDDLRSEGIEDNEARQEVSELTGHGRKEITSVYVRSVK